MIKSATAVKAKIKNKAGGNSDKSQIMLRIYLMERLLERVSLSKYKDNFVLKGGLVMVTTYGLKPSKYNGLVNAEVELDDLFYPV